MWLCSGALLWTETKKEVFGTLNTKSEGGRGRGGETETRVNSEEDQSESDDEFFERDRARGEHVGMSQLAAPPTSGSLGMSQLPAGGLLKL